jgi:putative thioredoxin
VAGPQAAPILNGMASYIDVTDATFESDVLERSKTTPVVVDLWAPWCGPCQTLGPIIERVVEATNGKVMLAKVNVDENPAVSQAFKVQGIPAVFALSAGQVVDTFQGSLPEAQVAEFVAKLVPAEELSEIEQLIAVGDEASLLAALEIEADNPEAVVALAELLVQSDRSDEGLKLLERIPESGETRRVAALARTGDVGDVETELGNLINQVKNDDDARQRFVDLLELLGAEDPRTAHWRKQLTMRLY